MDNSSNLSKNYTLEELIFLSEQESKDDEILLSLEEMLGIVYPHELLKDKIDNVVGFVDYEKENIEGEKEILKKYVDRKKAEIERRESNLEKIKKYFASVLVMHGIDTYNRLKGGAFAIWHNSTKSVKESLTVADVKDEYVNISVKFNYTDWQKVKNLIEKNSEKEITYKESEPVLNKTKIKEDIDADILDSSECVDINYHFKYGKSSAKPPKRKE